MTERHDAIVIGAGHNGLVAAFYLARAGLDVLVLERQDMVGGCAVTEEFHPGFRNSVASYTVSLLQPRVIADMALHDHGLRIVKRPMANFLPLPDGDALCMGGDMAAIQAEFARFDAHDADALPAYLAMIGRAADQLRRLALKPPPGAGDGWGARLDLLREALGMARMPVEEQRDLLALFTRSAEELLNRYFRHPAIQAVFGFDSIVGAWASPRSPGSAYVLLHHVFGEVDGEKGAWGHAMGGMGSITQAMAAAVRKAGGRIRTDAAVARVLVADGRATGVLLERGEEIAASMVLANVGPRILFGQMLAPADIGPDLARRLDGYRMGSGTFRMNVALSALPDFRSRPGPGTHLSAGIIMAPSLDYMHQAFVDSEVSGWSRAPVVEMLIPSTLDDSLAPPNCHVASLFCQHFAPKLPCGRPWDEAEEDAVSAIFDVVEQHAPGFQKLVVGRQTLSPLALERRFGLSAGDIFHGQMGLDQLWAARPFLGHGNYRGPVHGLYLCGSGSHPGGGVTGAPGHNAARVALSYWRWRRLRQ